MHIDRREFMKTSGAALAAIQTLGPRTALASALPPGSAKAFGRMAWGAGTWYRPYVSKIAHEPTAATWVQIDLGSPQSIDSFRLYPAFTPGDEFAKGFSFPTRFRIESSDDPSFSAPRLLVDQTAADFADPHDQINEFSAAANRARYIRLTATHLRPAQDGVGYKLALSKIEVLSAGQDVAVRRPVTADPEFGNPADLAQITRPPRPMGEGIVTDNPANITPSANWRTVPYLASAPLSGVSVQASQGLFRRAMENNIAYLLSSFSVDEMLRPFRERAGKPIRAGMRQPIAFWETALPGSSAGRFLMGAGNTLRWIDHPELRAWLNAIVDGIEECRQPNGYIMAYPEDTHSQLRARRLHPRLGHPRPDRSGLRRQPQGLPPAARILRLVRQLPIPAEVMRGAHAGRAGHDRQHPHVLHARRQARRHSGHPALLSGKLLA